MRILLDQGLPRSAAHLLRRDGMDAVHTGEVGLATASDSTVLLYARRHGRVVVTLDSDFHALIATSGADSPSAIRIRIEGMKGAAVASLVADLLRRFEDDLIRGALVSVTEQQVRVRGLPIDLPGGHGG